MANLSIIARCNRSCPYCFATEFLAALPTSVMDEAQYHRMLDFLQRSHIDQVRLLGGEPTLHPRFSAMVAEALARGFRVLVFSGGLIPPAARETILHAPADRVSVLLNIAAPGTLTAAEHRGQAATCAHLGQRAQLGFNIDRPGVHLDFLLPLISEYGLRRTIRLGLAHPVWGGRNECLHPRQYPEVGRRVAAFAERARTAGVTLDFDCGWVPCMFPPGALAAMGRAPGELGRRCGPILDLLPDGQVVSCYALARHAQEPLPDREDAAWLRARLADRQRAVRSFTLYPKCALCEFRARGECVGGCLSAASRRAWPGAGGSGS